MLPRCLLFLLVLVGSLHAASSAFPPAGIVPRRPAFEMEGYWVWDGSIIKAEDGRFHMFASRWPKDITFHPGWMMMSEVVRAVADRPEGPYHFQEVVLPTRGAQFWDGRATHNPTIRRHGDTYLLYYMGSTHPLADPKPGEKLELSDPRCIIGRANKRIGLATAKSINGPWTRREEPILATRPGTFYSFLTSNPSPVIHADGSVLMVFKARAYQGNVHGRMTLGLARAKHFTGPYEVVGNEPIFGPDHFGEVEDPFVWQSERGYEIIAKDMTGELVGEKHAAIHATSADGLKWSLSDPPKSYSRTLRWDDGKTETMGQLERPFVYFENGRPRILFCATSNGPGGFNNATKTWITAIPLEHR